MSSIITPAADELTAELKGTFLFEAFSDDQLRWLIDRTEVQLFQLGEHAFSTADTPDALWVLLKGEWRLIRSIEGRDVLMETATTPGEWAGWLPMLDTNVRLGLLMTKPSTLLRIPQATVNDLLTGSFPVANHLMSGLYGGITAYESMTRQQEKMAALGKLSAGLAHELNNPASAARRAAGQLRTNVKAMHGAALKLQAYRLTPEQVSFLSDTGHELIVSERSQPYMDPLARSDLEDELATWLSSHGIEEAWQKAPSLADAGVQVEQLDTLGDHLKDGMLAAAVDWLQITVETVSLLDQVERSTTRISELVKAVKEYTYMDQVGAQDVDIAAGLDNTLAIMAYKLRDVEVVREYDPALPHICGYGGELNQVWTNIIDNAVDALSGKGKLLVRTRQEDDSVIVEIVDNGPGIPDAVKSRIFDPFFTTKDVGKGTGLGLDISYRIVVQHHHGNMSVDSRPGYTCFRICLPLDQKE